jgi:hypothetical protein
MKENVIHFVFHELQKTRLYDIEPCHQTRQHHTGLDQAGLEDAFQLEFTENRELHCRFLGSRPCKTD